VRTAIIAGIVALLVSAASASSGRTWTWLVLASVSVTASARRWVAVPSWLMVDVQETCPPDDRTAERRVFPGFTPSGAKNAMRKACENASIAHFHPHDLRHRYASVKIAEGVPVTRVAAQLGHSKKSLTLDTYSHVLVD
jgi:integrase